MGLQKKEGKKKKKKKNWSKQGVVYERSSRLLGRNERRYARTVR